MQKEQILTDIFEDLDNASRKLVFKNSDDKEVKEMIDRCYQIIESTKLAVRGAYHTK